jgi:hypothetical protein
MAAALVGLVSAGCSDDKQGGAPGVDAPAAMDAKVDDAIAIDAIVDRATELSDASAQDGSAPDSPPAHASGTLDQGFGASGIVQTSLLPESGGAEAMLVLPDGKILVAGTNDANLFFARFRPTGALDTSFGTNGVTKVPLAPDRGEVFGLAT